jgi:hypothetical protein
MSEAIVVLDLLSPLSEFVLSQRLKNYVTSMSQRLDLGHLLQMRMLAPIPPVRFLFRWIWLARDSNNIQAGKAGDAR